MQYFGQSKYIQLNAALLEEIQTLPKRDNFYLELVETRIEDPDSTFKGITIFFALYHGGDDTISITGYSPKDAIVRLRQELQRCDVDRLWERRQQERRQSNI